jgi:hypothetical protein
MEPYWFGSLGPDPHKLNPDPQFLSETNADQQHLMEGWEGGDVFVCVRDLGREQIC